MVQSNELLKWTGRTLKATEGLLGHCIRYGRKKNCGIEVFLEPLHIAITFQRFPCVFKKWVSLLDSFTDIFRNMHFLCNTIHKIPEVVNRWWS